MRGVFVTGTDTDIGKTFFSAFLSFYLSFEEKLTYFKPIQAGAPLDQDFVKSICGNRIEYRNSTYLLKKPASPDRSAFEENIEIDLSEIEEGFKQIETPFTVVEGAGGLLVPLNKDQTVVDLVRKLEIPAIVVTSGRLGTINHTFLTLNALKNQGISCHGIVICGEEDPELEAYFQDKLDVPVLLRLPHFEEISPEAFTNFIEKNHSKLQTLKTTILEDKNPAEDHTKLQDKDKKFVWHPFTQHGIVKDHPVVRKGAGSYLYFDKRKVIDGISSWWVNLFGHSNPELARSIKSQVDELEHVIFAGFTHKPAIELSEKLVNMTRESGAELDKVFYSDNGSTCVEVALKMSYQYFQQSPTPSKKRFLALNGSYHGDTLGAMSVGERKGFNEVFTSLMFDVDFVNPFDLEELRSCLEKNGEQYAGVIVEPMIQGASGMRMYSSEVLDLIEAKKRELGYLVICDEVFTGFYRTGKMFAFEHSGLRPDFLCLSKGLTGGFLPLAATLVSDRIYEAFYNEDMRKAFLHGHSYTANPMACAVASKTMDLLKTKETQEKIEQISQWTRDCLANLEGVSGVSNVRQLGTIGAMEINGEDPNYFKGDFAYQVMRKSIDRGVLLRPLGGTLYAVPPYCVTKSELEKIYETMKDLITKDLP